jgi:hypothetical protein
MENKMDLKQYFKKIRDTEAAIHEQYPLIVSLETPDGGKSGAVIEVSRQEAARAIVENRAVLANDEQGIAYFEREATRKKSVEKAELSRRLQIAILSDSEFRDAVTGPERVDEPTGSR